MLKNNTEVDKNISEASKIASSKMSEASKNASSKMSEASKIASSKLGDASNFASSKLSDASNFASSKLGDASNFASSKMGDASKIAFIPNNFLNFFINGIQNPFQIDKNYLQKNLLIFKLLITDNETLKEFESILKLLTPFISLFLIQLNKSLLVNEDKIKELIKDLVIRIASTSLDSVKTIPIIGNGFGLVSSIAGAFDSIKKSIELGSFTISNGLFTPIESVLKEINETISNYDELDKQTQDTINKTLKLMKKIENMSNLPLEKIKEMENKANKALENGENFSKNLIKEMENKANNANKALENGKNLSPKVVGGSKYKTKNNNNLNKFKKYRNTIKKCINLFKKHIVIHN